MSIIKNIDDNLKKYYWNPFWGRGTHVKKIPLNFHMYKIEFVMSMMISHYNSYILYVVPYISIKKCHFYHFRVVNLPSFSHTIFLWLRVLWLWFWMACVYVDWNMKRGKSHKKREGEKERERDTICQLNTYKQICASCIYRSASEAFFLWKAEIKSNSSSLGLSAIKSTSLYATMHASSARANKLFSILPHEFFPFLSLLQPLMLPPSYTAKLKNHEKSGKTKATALTTG